MSLSENELVTGVALRALDLGFDVVHIERNYGAKGNFAVKAGYRYAPAAGDLTVGLAAELLHAVDASERVAQICLEMGRCRQIGG